MTDQPSATPSRSYGCTFGCGNPYDYIVISVADGSAEFLCLPCYVRLATDMIEAVISPDGAKVIAALADAGHIDIAPQTHDLPKQRGKNAPVASDDDDLIEAYNSVVTVDELPDEFR